MFYNKKYPENKDKVLLSDIDREDRIEEGFNNVEREFDEVHDKMDMVKDYVVDFGSNSNGKWEKWASGKLVQRGVVTLTGTTEAYGTLFRSDTTTSVDYPLEFTNTPDLNLQNNGPGAFGNVIQWRENYGFGVRLLHTYNQRVATDIYWEAIGLWK